MLVLLLAKGGECWSARGGTRPRGWGSSKLLRRNPRLLTGTSERLAKSSLAASSGPKQTPSFARSSVFDDPTKFYKDREKPKYNRENSIAAIPGQKISRGLSTVRRRNSKHLDSHQHTKGHLRKHNQSQLQKPLRRRPVRKEREVDPVKAGVDFSLAVFDPEVGKMCVTKEEEVASTERQRVLECNHKSVEKCHYTYVTQFKPSQEEVCEENFEKSCQITFKQQAYNETVRKCYRPTRKVCNGEGPEECRTVFESSCTTKYVEKQPGKFVGDTGCEKLPVEICGAGCTFEEGEEECHDKVLTSVVDVPEEVCDLNPQKTCRFVTKLVPRLKPTHQCTIVPQQVCQLKFSSPQQVKKPLLTKWCLDETPAQPGELYPSEEERSSGGTIQNGLGPILLDQDLLDFEEGEQDKSFSEDTTPKVDDQPTKPPSEPVERHDTTINQQVQLSPGSIGNIDFGDGIVVDVELERGGILVEGEQLERDNKGEATTELPLLDLELGLPDQDSDLPQVTFEVPKVNSEVSSEKGKVEVVFEREEDVVTEDLDYGDELPVEDAQPPTSATASANGDNEEFVTFVDETFPADNFENYELRY